MAEPEKPMTHVVWAKRYRGRHFLKWVQVGEARIEVDGTGVITVHVFEDCTVRGDTGYSCLLPMGLKPPAPPPQAKRPATSGDDEIIPD